MSTTQVKDKAVENLQVGLIKTPEKAGDLALEFVLDRIGSGALSRESLSKLRDAIPNITEATDINLNPKRLAFIEKYGISALAESQVALKLPEGSSRIDFLKEAQALANELHGRNHTWPERLNIWTKEEVFTTKIKEPLELAVDGNVKGSTNHTRSEQEAKNWNDVDIQDLAVAHAAYFIVTGKDLFAGNVVRARGGALYFDSYGLGLDGYGGDFRARIVSACRAFPFPESKN